MLSSWQFVKRFPKSSLLAWDIFLTQRKDRKDGRRPYTQALYPEKNLPTENKMAPDTV